MENQMKVCFVTLEQFNTLWTKAQPQERFTPDLTTLCLMLKKYNTLFIVGSSGDFIISPEEAIPDHLLIVEKRAA